MTTIEIEKLTDEHLLKRVINHVFGAYSTTTLDKWYQSQHSPIRTQLFAIFITDLRYSVAMQLRTHEKNGALILIEPGRPDTGTKRCKEAMHNDDYRGQKRNAFVLCNAQHLIDWSHKRLCNKAESHTVEFFGQLRDAVAGVDAPLAAQMVPMCVYRNGMCSELRPCGLMEGVVRG